MLAHEGFENWNVQAGKPLFKVACTSGFRFQKQIWKLIFSNRLRGRPLFLTAWNFLKHRFQAIAEPRVLRRFILNQIREVAKDTN